MVAENGNNEKKEFILKEIDLIQKVFKAPLVKGMSNFDG
jgi:hypothetical protein